MKNIAFFNRDVLSYEPRTVAPDMAANRALGGLQLRGRAGRTTSSPTTAGSCVSATCSRCSTWKHAVANQVARMKLEVDTLAPVHGKPVPWSAFQAALDALSQRTR